VTKNKKNVKKETNIMPVSSVLAKTYVCSPDGTRKTLISVQLPLLVSDCVNLLWLVCCVLMKSQQSRTSGWPRRRAPRSYALSQRHPVTRHIGSERSPHW